MLPNRLTLSTISSRERQLVDPKNGGADCGGICSDEPEPAFCGGFTGIPCPKGQTCIDDPSDECDPKTVAPIAAGICIDSRR